MVSVYLLYGILNRVWSSTVQSSLVIPVSSMMFYDIRGSEWFEERGSMCEVHTVNSFDSIRKSLLRLTFVLTFIESHSLYRPAVSHAHTRPE